MSSLEVNDFDYMAHFQLGWLYLWVLNEPTKAEQAFERAASRSFREDEYFHALAARHLAFAYFTNGKYPRALQIIQEAKEFTEHEHVLVEYEHLRYCLYAGDPDPVLEYFEPLANDHSLYYLLLQTESPYTKYPELKALAETIRLNKIDAIRQQIDKRWEQSHMRLIQMEEGCNVNRIYLRTLNRYLPELDAVPFIELQEKAKPLEDKVFETTHEGISAEIDKRHALYDEEINHRRQQYAWANRVGKLIFSISLYIIIALLVLGIYLVMDRYFMESDSGITVYDWMIGLSVMIVMMIIGFVFTIFETSQVKKLYAKQKLVDDALDKLQKDT